MSEDPKGFVIKTTLFRMREGGSSLDRVAIFSSHIVGKIDKRVFC